MSSVALNISPTSRRRAATAVVLACLAAGAWFASLDRMGGAGMADRFSVGSLGFFVVLWVSMMAAMMFPSAWPAVALYGLVVRRRAAAGVNVFGRSLAFVAGYVGSWAAFGLVAFSLLALVRAAGLGTLSGVGLSRYVVAPLALAGALYQLTPIKQVCLRHCRGPLAFFMGHWRDGARGAVAMGARHGTYCVGCCWMLMVVLLGLGVMSVTWMAVVSAAIAVEKLSPAAWARLATGLLTTGLVFLSVIAAAKPSLLPGLADAGDMEPSME
jgi:predicted metal-binding membrane protein